MKIEVTECLSCRLCADACKHDTIQSNVQYHKFKKMPLKKVLN